MGFLGYIEDLILQASIDFPWTKVWNDNQVGVWKIKNKEGQREKDLIFDRVYIASLQDN